MTTKPGPKIPFQMEMTFTHGQPREIWPGVQRIVAPNSGPLTQNGTNTYILGTTSFALIDPGPDDQTHLGAILNTLAGKPLTHIFVTHTHKDHSPLSKQLKEKTGALICAHAALTKDRGTRVKSSDPLRQDFVDLDFAPDHILSDGDIIESKEWALKAIHTPGHAPDHLCFAHQSEPLLFSGDHVMAWNTSVIIPPEGRMSDYLASLKKIIGHGYERLLPGHGGQARTPDRLVKAYLMHRKWRETAILEHIQAGESTIDALLPLLYPHAKPEVQGAASLSILSHVEHLAEQGLLTIMGHPIALDVSFEAKKTSESQKDKSLT